MDCRLETHELMIDPENSEPKLNVAKGTVIVQEVYIDSNRDESFQSSISRISWEVKQHGYLAEHLHSQSLLLLATYSTPRRSLPQE